MKTHRTSCCICLQQQRQQQQQQQLQEQCAFSSRSVRREARSPRCQDRVPCSSGVGSLVFDARSDRVADGLGRRDCVAGEVVEEHASTPPCSEQDCLRRDQMGLQAFHVTCSHEILRVWHRSLCPSPLRRSSPRSSCAVLQPTSRLVCGPASLPRLWWVVTSIWASMDMPCVLLTCLRGYPRGGACS